MDDFEVVVKQLGDNITESQRKTAAELAEIKSRLLGAEQELVERLAPGGNVRAVETDAMGEKLKAEMKEIVSAVQQKRCHTFELPVKSFGRKTLVTDGAGNSPQHNISPAIERLGGVWSDPRIQYSVAGTLRSLPVGSENFDFVQLDAAYAAAAGYQENQGDVKPEGNPNFELSTARIADFAHYIRVSKQAVADYSNLQGYLGDLMLYGLRRKVDIELQNGDGSGKHLHGITAVANSFSATGTISERIAKTALALRKAGYQPDTVLITADDDLAANTVKATGTGDYLIPPQGIYFGLNAVPSVDFANNTAYVYDSKAMLLLERQTATVTVGYINDQFIRNEIAILAESRVGLAILSPAGIKKVTLT